MTAVFDVEAGLKRAEGDFAAAMVGDRERRGPTEVEMIAIPDVGLNDPPTADERQFAGALMPASPAVLATAHRL